MENFDVVILVNGAGELSALVKPTVEQLVKDAPNSRVILVITPCQYATGHEYRIAKEIKGIHRIIRPAEYLKWLLLRLPPKDLKFNKKGIVIFMGGDLIHGKILSKRLKYPAIAYTENPPYHKEAYAEFLVPDQIIFDKLVKRKLSQDKIKIVNNLMIEGIKSTLTKEEVIKKWNLDPNKQIISFLPGSRTFQIKITIPYYIEVAKLIKANNNNNQLAFVLSPYMPTSHFIKVAKRKFKDIQIEGKDGSKYLIKDDLRILLVETNQFDFIHSSTLVVTIPGTNTGEIAALGAPMLVFFPFDRIDKIPFEGVFGWICSLPIIGFYLKVISGRMIDRGTRFFALPNKKIGREIVPEIRGWFKPKDVAEKVISLLEDREKLEEMKKNLKIALGPNGAAGNVVKEILKVINI